MRVAEWIFQKLWAEIFEDWGGDYHPAYQALEVEYAQPYRSYHNFDHIEEMVVHIYDDPTWPLGAIGQREKFTAIAAAFFHDVVDPRKKGAVALSADHCFREMMSWGIIKPTSHLMVIATNASRAILDTDEHVSYTVVGQKLIDADLMRFVEGDWRKWAQQIRQEYYDVPNEVFDAGRLEILKGFRSRSPFFYFEQHRDCEAYRRIDEQIAELTKA